MKLDEMVNYVNDQVGETVVGFRTPEHIKSWCRAACRHIYRLRSDWNFLLMTRTTNLVAGQEAYLLPSDFFAVKEVMVNGVVYQAIPFDRKGEFKGAARYFLLATDQGETYIHLTSPSAESTENGLQMVYSRTPNVLPTDNSEPVFHKAFHEAIPLRACYYAMRKELEQVRQEFLDESNAVIKQLVAYDQRVGGGGKVEPYDFSGDKFSQASRYRDMY